MNERTRKRKEKLQRKAGRTRKRKDKVKQRNAGTNEQTNERTIPYRKTLFSYLKVVCTQICLKS